MKTGSADLKNDGHSPVVLAYGIRWDRKLWTNVQKKKLPQFNEFRTVGVYFYYWKGKPVYIGIGAGKLHRRIYLAPGGGR